MKFRSSRALIDRNKKNRLGESMNHYEEIFCCYGLRENPKRSQKSRNKKRLIRCEECSKGFRYEKCLTKHRQVMHSLKQKKSESTRRDLLCRFIGVQRRKRSKRVSRYKKSHRFSVYEDHGELLQVAESLILLSKSGEALVSSLREFEDRFLGNEQKLVVGISAESDGSSKELLGFLGDKKALEEEEDESGQLKRVGAKNFVGSERVSVENRPGLLLENAETDIKQKLDGQETAFGDWNSGNEMNSEYRCRNCDRVFSTYQALGGHQTFHRTRNNSAQSKLMLRMAQ